MKSARYALAITLGVVPASAQAATCTASSSGVNFGVYDPFASFPLEGAGRIDVRCDELVVAEVTLGPGQGSFAERRLASGASGLAYNLFTSSQFVTVWGDGVGSTATRAVSGSSAALTVYGVIQPGQNVVAGNYSDVVVVSVAY